MHRTQLLIEDWQYEALRTRAEREGRSLSAVVREILRTALTTDSRTRLAGIATLEGIGEDPGIYGEDHDRYLYGENHASAEGPDSRPGKGEGKGKGR